MTVNAEVLEALERKRSGVIKALLEAKERYVDDQLSEADARAFRQAIIREVNKFADGVTHLVREVGDDRVELTVEFLALIGFAPDDADPELQQLYDRLVPTRTDT